jgi:hypothetical protein
MQKNGLILKTMKNKLFFFVIGCKPKGRFTEQHDVFLGIATHWEALIPEMKKSWPEAKGKIHIDSWREVTQIEEYALEIEERTAVFENTHQAFFINLGGYKPNDLEEYHYKMLLTGKNKAEVVKKAKQSAFYKHVGFKGAASHIDDQYGIDVDDLYPLEDLLSEKFKKEFRLKLSFHPEGKQDELHVGYLKIR